MSFLVGPTQPAISDKVFLSSFLEQEAEQKSSFFLEMEELIADCIKGLGLALPVALIVALRAGRIVSHITALNLQNKVNDLSITVLKEQIVYQLKNLFTLYKDTTDINFHLPPEINLDQVAADLFFLEGTVQSLNEIHLSLLNQCTESPHFIQVLDVVISLGGGERMYQWAINSVSFYYLKAILEDQIRGLGRKKQISLKLNL